MPVTKFPGFFCVFINLPEAVKNDSRCCNVQVAVNLIFIKGE